VPAPPPSRDREAGCTQISRRGSRLSSSLFLSDNVGNTTLNKLIPSSLPSLYNPLSQPLQVVVFYKPNPNLHPHSRNYVAQYG
jgi:hypothetical protein